MSFNPNSFGRTAVGLTNIAQHTSPQLYGAASHNAVLSEAAMMFGPPRASAIQQYGDDVNRTHIDLFEAYEGQNLYLADTIVGFVLMTPDFALMVLPPLQTNTMTVEWNVYEFNNLLAQPTPYEGTSRLVSAKKHGNRASMSRYGIAFVMEGDMVGSPEGRTAYKRNQQMMSMACLETVHYHTIYALLNCKNVIIERADQYKHERSTAASIADLEAADFASLAYDPAVFVRMIERHAAVMRRDRFEPDTLIVFPGFTWHKDHVVAEPTYTEYWVFGPRGTQVLVPGPVAPGRFRGIPVYEGREFGVQTAGGVLPLQPLAQKVSVGEFYLMSGESLRGAVLDATYESRWRGVALYDFDRDNYRVISFGEALLHSRIFGGNPSDPDGLAPQTDLLVQKINAGYKDGSEKFEDDMRVYSNPMALENTGFSRAPRRHYMFVSHNTVSEAAEKVKKFSEFDIDVLPTSDLMQMATSLKARIFAMRGECNEETLCGIEDLFVVLDQFETAEYNAAFLRALINENIDRSVNADGEFIGIRDDDSQPIDWRPNAFGGLDLPLRTAASGWSDVPPGLANWNMIVTYAAQAEARGYGTEATNPAIGRSKRAVKAVRQLLKALNATAGSSVGLKSAAGPPWIHALKSEAALFNGLHVARPPVALAVLGDQRSSSIPVVQGTQGVGPILWNAGGASEVINTAAVSRSKVLSAIRGVTDEAALNARLEGFNDLEDTVMSRVSKGSAELQRKFRPLYIDKLWALATFTGGDPVNAVAAKTLFESKLLEAETIMAESPDSFTGEQADRIIKLLTDAKPKRTRDLRRPDDTPEIQKFGNALLKLYTKGGFSVAVPGGSFRNSEGAGSVVRSALELSEEWFAEIPSGMEYSRAGIMSNLEENLAINAAILSSVLGITGSHSVLERAAMQAGASVAAELAEFQKAKRELDSVAAKFDSDFRAHLNNNDIRIGNDVPVDAARISRGSPVAYYRSPLSLTPALLNSLVGSQDDNSEPLIAPMNPDDYYRTVIYPEKGSDVSWVLHVKRQPQMGEMIGNKVPLGVNRLRAQTLFQSKLKASSWKNPYAGVRVARSGSAFDDGFRVGVVKDSMGRARVEDRSTVDQRLAEANAIRARLGAPMRKDIDIELAKAEESRAALDREFQNAERRSEILRQFATSSMHAGVHEGQQHTGALGRALYNTASYDEHSAGRAETLRKQYPYSFGAYAGSADARTSEYLVDRGNATFVAPSHQAAAGMFQDGQGRWWQQVADPTRADVDEENNDLEETPESNAFEHPNRVYRYSKLDQIEDPILRLITMAILELPVTSTAFMTLVQANVYIPINFILWRLNITFEMWSIILMRSGIETGANLIGPSNLVFNNSALDKMLVGHFTFHNAPVVFNHRGVSILRNVFPRAYLAGWNTQWLQTPDELRRDNRGSLIASVSPITEQIDMNRISFTDTTAPLDHLHLTNRPSGLTAVPDHSSAAFNEISWGFAANGAFKDRTSENYFFVELKVNERASAGKHFTYDRMRGSFSVCHAGASPLSGSRTGPRCAPIWNGVPGLFPSQEAFDADSRIQ